MHLVRILAGIAAGLIAVPAANAITISVAKIDKGAVQIKGRQATPSAVVQWEGQPVTHATNTGGFRFATAVLPQDCVGELTDGTTTTPVVIEGCAPVREVEGPPGPKGDKGDRGDSGPPGSAASIVAWNFRFDPTVPKMLGSESAIVGIAEVPPGSYVVTGMWNTGVQTIGALCWLKVVDLESGEDSLIYLDYVREQQASIAASFSSGGRINQLTFACAGPTTGGAFATLDLVILRVGSITTEPFLPR